MWRILAEWNNGAGQREHTDEELEAFEQRWCKEADREVEEDKTRRAELVAQNYDEKRADSRLQLLRKVADVAFFQHVIDAPASAAQLKEAARRRDESQAEAQEFRRQVGNPDDVLDNKGYFPAERRKQHLDAHVRYWRYPMLRELRQKDRRQFKTLLEMPVLDATHMCSECQAPTEWHEYDLTLQLFRARPARGSVAEKLSVLMPGWWEGDLQGAGGGDL